MDDEATLGLVKFVGKTLQHLEHDGDPDDPAVQNLRHSLLLIMAELELIKDEKKKKLA